MLLAVVTGTHMLLVACHFFGLLDPLDLQEDALSRCDLPAFPQAYGCITGNKWMMLPF